MDIIIFTVSSESQSDTGTVSVIISQEDKTIMKQIERDADYTFQVKM